MTQTLDTRSGVPALLNGRQDRIRSFDLADFPPVTGREEEWRFTPVKRLADFFEDAGTDAALSITTDLPEQVTVETIDLEAARALGILEPEDRPAVIAAARAGE